MLGLTLMLLIGSAVAVWWLAAVVGALGMARLVVAFV
jgi:hypothetical protein